MSQRQSFDSTYISQAGQYSRPDAEVGIPSEGESDERRRSVTWAQSSSRSLPQPNSPTVHLSDDHTLQREDKDNLSTEDTSELTTPGDMVEIPCHSHEVSAEPAIEACSPNAVFPDEVQLEEVNLNVSSLMDKRTARSRYILEQRRQAMEAHVNVWSSSHPPSIYADKWKATTVWNRRATAPSIDYTTDRKRISVGGTLFGPLAHRRSSTPGGVLFNTQCDPVQLLDSLQEDTNAESLQRYESLSHPTDVSDQNQMESEMHSQSNLSPLRSWLPTHSNRLERNQEQQATGIHGARQQHAELHERQHAGRNIRQHRSSPISQASLSLEGHQASAKAVELQSDDDS